MKSLNRDGSRLGSAATSLVSRDAVGTVGGRLDKDASGRLCCARLFETGGMYLCRWRSAGEGYEGASVKAVSIRCWLGLGLKRTLEDCTLVIFEGAETLLAVDFLESNKAGSLISAKPRRCGAT